MLFWAGTTFATPISNFDSNRIQPIACTACIPKPKSCPLIESLGSISAAQKSNLTQFCNATWTDAVLFTVLTEIKGWASNSFQQSFINTFAANPTFQAALIQEPTLVKAWQYLQEADANKLRIIVNELMPNHQHLLTYKNILTKFVILPNLTDRTSFLSDFSANSAALTQLNTSNGNLVEAWFLAWSRTVLRKDLGMMTKVANCLFHNRLRNIGIGSTELQTILTRLAADYGQAGASTTGTYSSLANKLEMEIFDNLFNFGNFLDRNPSTTFVNFANTISKLTQTQFTNRKAAAWILQNISTDDATFGNRTLTVEYTVTNAAGNSAFIDIYANPMAATVTASPKTALFIEFKAGPQSVDASMVLKELVGRDLINIRNFDQLQWRISEYNLTKTKLNGWLSSTEGIAALGAIPSAQAALLLGKSYVGALPRDIANDFINYFNDQKNYDSIFK